MITCPKSLLIDGNYVYDDIIIAYCHCTLHRGYLTEHLEKLHKCVAKECPFFEKRNPGYMEVPVKLESEKNKHQLQKKKALGIYSDRDVLIRKTLEDNGHIHVTSIRDEKFYQIVIYFIYEMRTDLDPEVQFLKRHLKKASNLFRGKALMKFLNG